MIYIKLELSDSFNKTKNKIINFIFSKIYRIRNKFKKIKEEKIDSKIVLTINDTNTDTLNKLSKYINNNCISLVCLSDNLMQNKDFIKFLNDINVKVLDGMWLFKHLVPSTLDYIVKCKKEKIEFQEVAILSNDVDNILFYIINEISKNVRVLNIITNNENKFRNIEKKLYQENGIVLNMNNNLKKSLISSDIIYNYDFSEEELNTYSINPKACIINLNKKSKINSKSFNGINSNFFEIALPKQYIKNLVNLNGFDASILYESFIYKNTNPYNIVKELANDNVHILFLIGEKGKIRKSEYLKLSKKIAN